MPEPSARTVRRHLFPGIDVVLPPPVGEVTLKLDHASMERIEEELDEELDRLNLRIQRGIGPIDEDTGLPIDAPFPAVWDALSHLADRRLSLVCRVLLVSEIVHEYGGDRRAADAAVNELPPDWYHDAELVDSMMEVVGIAWGADPEATPTDPPPPPTGGDSSQSGGTTSSPSGPPPPPPEV